MTTIKAVTITKPDSRGLSWDNVKTRVYPRLLPVNYVKDSIELVTEVSSVIRVAYFMDFPEVIEVPVTTEMFSDWGISEADLYMQAVANLPDAKLEKYSDYMIKHTTEEQRQQAGINELELSLFAPPFFVLENGDDSLYGSAQILNQKNLDEVHDFVSGDFYMIPSSLHEWLIAPCEKMSYATPQNLLEMNCAGNNAFPQDILGSFVLKYDGKEVTRVA